MKINEPYATILKVLGYIITALLGGGAGGAGVAMMM